MAAQVLEQRHSRPGESNLNVAVATVDGVTDEAAQASERLLSELDT
jgi:hypothetical protein